MFSRCVLPEDSLWMEVTLISKKYTTSFEVFLIIQRFAIYHLALCNSQTKIIKTFLFGTD